MTIVRLSWREVRLAAFAAVDRRIFALANRLPDHHGRPSAERGWEVDIQGILGEFVVCRLFDCYWPGGVPKSETSGDASRLQVRSTVHENGGLIVYADDVDDAPFILVVGVPPQFRVAGWLAGREAKRDRWRKPEWIGEPFLVPQSQLRPISELVDAPRSEMPS